MFHNFKGMNENDIYEHTNILWHSYCNVNKLFVEAALQIKKEKDLIWINDLHLLLAPCYLRRKCYNSNIGFFLHSPFPSSDIFTAFQYKVEVLKSLLCSDLIGFHQFKFARNFFISCRRVLQLYTVNLKEGYLGI